MTNGAAFIDGDFDSGTGNCPYHCSPSCHPAQVGPDWVYGCRHPAWPQNRDGDFVPIVECGGNKKKCDLAKSKLLGRWQGGIKRRLKTVETKRAKLKDDLNFLEDLHFDPA